LSRVVNTQLSAWHHAPRAAAPGSTPLVAWDDGAGTLPGRFLWDPWPVQELDGSVVRVPGGELWVALVANATADPEERHGNARQHLLLLGSTVQDLGPLFPVGASAGSREWSGSTVLDRGRGVLSAYYTAAGGRDEPQQTLTQRILLAEGEICLDENPVRVQTWTPHRELVTPAPPYLPSGVTSPGQTLRAFRDPGWFRDPADGTDHLLVAASVDDPVGKGPWGAVGLARRSAGDEWVLERPLLAAVGVNRELERPHVVVHDGRYYLFVSTQQHMFEPGVTAPTGLYGFVAHSLRGPYRPVNRTGLVIANPTHRPHATYAWLVLPDLRVASFVNYPEEPATRSPRPAPSARFAGAFAPLLRLHLSQDRAAVTPLELEEELA
jgi:levansucrase